MTPTEFLSNFGHLAGAPNGVQKLRDLILQLAVQGKLMAQDPNDEPAGNLIERAQAHITDLINSSAIKRQKYLSSELFEDPSADLPDLWAWTTLGRIGLINPRNAATDDAEAGFVPMPLISEFYGEPVRHDVKEWREIKSGYTHIADGDVVLAKITPCFENGKSAVIEKLPNHIGAGTTDVNAGVKVHHRPA